MRGKGKFRTRHDATTRSNKVVKKLVEIFPNHRRRHHHFSPTLTPPHDGDAWFREVQGGEISKFKHVRHLGWAGFWMINLRYDGRFIGLQMSRSRRNEHNFGGEK